MIPLGRELAWMLPERELARPGLALGWPESLEQGWLWVSKPELRKHSAAPDLELRQGFVMGRLAKQLRLILVLLLS
jgi:hypothetical protein